MFCTCFITSQLALRLIVQKQTLGLVLKFTVLSGLVVVKVWHVLRLLIEEMSSRIWRVVVNKLGIQGGYLSRVGCLETADGVTGQRLMLPDCYEMLHSAWGLNRGSGGRLVVLWL